MANIHVKKTNIEGLYVIEPIVFSDHRGIYFETYNYEALSSYGLNYHFVQDNESVSKKGVLRGMHVNMKHPQGKLIRVLSGEILDVVIDLRKESKTYMSCFSICLSAQNYKQLYIPDDEIGFAWNSAAINIDWGIQEPIQNSRDKNSKDLSEVWL